MGLAHVEQTLAWQLVRCVTATEIAYHWEQPTRELLECMAEEACSGLEEAV